MLDDNVKIQLYAISLSGILYGISLISFFELAPRLLRKRHKKIMDVQFFIFITTMFLLGTAALAQGLFYLEHSGSIFLTGTTNSTITVTAQEVEGSGGLNYFTRLGVPISLPLTVLGSNGLTIWRLVGLSRDTTHKARLLLLVVLCLLFLSSLGGAVEFLVQEKLIQKSSDDTTKPRVAIVPLATTIPNILLSMMTIRFLWKRAIADGQRGFEVNKNPMAGANQPSHVLTPRPRHMRTEKNNLALVVLAIAIDSNILVALLSFVHIVLSETKTPFPLVTKSMVTLQMLPQISVLSSTLAVESIVKEDQRRLQGDARHPDGLGGLPTTIITHRLGPGGGLGSSNPVTITAQARSTSDRMATYRKE